MDARHVSQIVVALRPARVTVGGAVYEHYGYNLLHAPAAVVTPPTAAAIPVIATTAEKQNVSDYLTGLGTVQAFNRVTVHVRVDGELQDIRFTEGQFVHAGDLLAQIDPRLFRAALDQARAKKARVLYESYIHPITILSTLPSAGLGALLTLKAGGFELSLIAIIGIILLIGIVKKNAIMMIDFALVAERERGLTPAEAIYQACLLRFRPIMMTTMAALLGGLPLMLGTGTGSEIRRPLGFAIVGGLVVSQFLTLYTTPVVYLYLDRLHGWLRGARAGAPSRAQALLMKAG